MDQCRLHFTRIGQAVFLGLIMLCAGGCWQEIEYRGPDPAPRPSQPAPATAAKNDAGGQVSSDFMEPARFSDSTDSNQIPSPDASADDPPPNPVENNQLPIADTNARTVSATVESAPPPRSVNTRRAAWLLGSKLSMAALAHDRGVAADDVPRWFEEIRSMADLLQTSVAELPDRPAESEGDATSRQVLSYLLDQGKQIGGDLATDHGADHAALFEVAMKSNLLLVLYKPGSSVVDHLSTAIAVGAPRANLPPELSRPLLDMLASGSSPATVRAAVRRMHADVDRHLTTAAEQ